MVNFLASQRSCATRDKVNHLISWPLTRETIRFLVNECFISI